MSSPFPQKLYSFIQILKLSYYYSKLLIKSPCHLILVFQYFQRKLGIILLLVSFLLNFVLQEYYKILINYSRLKYQCI